jgi:hypothetical protein
MRKSSKKITKVARIYVIIATVLFSVWLGMTAVTMVNETYKLGCKWVNVLVHSVPQVSFVNHSK